jgi:ElaA protein
MGNKSIVTKTWGEFTPDEVFEMAVLRSEVFFLEQHITEEEFDATDRDPLTRHLWMSDDHGMAAYLRIVTSSGPTSHHGISTSLGRMVVRKDARGKGLATDLLVAALDLVGDEPVYVHAQDYVTGLYAAHGFVEQGDLFEEAGIPHRLMVRGAPEGSTS